MPLTKAHLMTTTLRSSVKNESISSKQGLLQSLFAVWFDAFVYNQIWEDPRVDIEALDLRKDSRILTISSGGCNALNYLLEDPKSVTAVDLNRHHIYLLNLKLAALRHLPEHEKFFAFFGAGRGENTGTDYQKYIAHNLDKDTRKFWESNTFLGSVVFGDRIAFFRDAGLYEHSRNGYFLRFFHWLARRLGCKVDEVLKARTLEEQAELYNKHIDPFFDRVFIKLIGKLPVTLFGLGIPPQQYDELKRDLSGDRTVIDIYRDRVRRLACAFPIEENYFAWQAFARKYDTENRRAIPDYLREENFETLRANANRLETKVGSATDEIRNNPTGRFNRFVFLDAQDWMDADSIIELWSVIAEKAERGARIIFRTAGATSPVETSLPEELRSRFVYEKELSENLFKRDRSSIYGGFHLYVKN
jgi:S-adenosylmethionine-diacylglycerol 3-amino-3-carboxypropyl transferase